MTSPETTDETTTVSITITDLDLPETDEERKAAIETLREDLRTLIATEFEQPTTEVDVQIGHWFASVSPTCPDCGEALDIQDIHLGDGEDAFAVARCTDTCGWAGDAVFKLIDLDNGVDGNYESSVHTRNKTPKYYPYCDRNS